MTSCPSEHPVGALIVRFPVAVMVLTVLCMPFWQTGVAVVTEPTACNQGEPVSAVAVTEPVPEGTMLAPDPTVIVAVVLVPVVIALNAGALALAVGVVWMQSRVVPLERICQLSPAGIPVPETHPPPALTVGVVETRAVEAE